MSKIDFQKPLLISLILYTISLYTSMAAMEFFTWLTFLFCVLQISIGRMKLRPVGGAIFLWGLLATVLVGIFVNASPEADRVYMLGRLRWIFTFYSTTYVLGSINLNIIFLRFLNYLVGVIAFYAVIQAFTGVDLFRTNPIIYPASANFFRSTGLFSMPTTFAHAIGMFFFFPFAFFFLDKKNALKYRLAYFVTALLVVVAILTSLTRGAYVGLFVGVIVCSFLIQKRLALIHLVISLALGGSLVLSSNIFKERVEFAGANQRSMNARINLWKANWEMFKDYPFFGIGYTLNEDAAKVYFTKMGIKQDLVSHAHNNYLNFLSSAGFFGFFFYFCFTIYFLVLTYNIWRRLPEDQTTFRALVLGSFGAQIFFHVCGLTDTNFTDMEVKHQFMFILALVSSISYKSNLYVHTKDLLLVKKP